MDEIRVQCYAGLHYPERPVSFDWEGKEHQVAEVEREWKEPGVYAFVVRDEAGDRFELSYREAEQRWTGRPLPHRRSSLNYRRKDEDHQG